jgi:hypothetical protein
MDRRSANDIWIAAGWKFPTSPLHYVSSDKLEQPRKILQQCETATALPTWAGGYMPERLKIFQNLAPRHVGRIGFC